MKKLLLVFGVSILLLTGCSAVSPTSDAAVSPTSDALGYQFQTVSEDTFKASLSKVDSAYDEFDERTTYRLYTEERDDVFFSPIVYVEGESGSVSPQLGVFFRAADWIFFDSMDIRVNDETIPLFSAVASYEKYTDVDSPSVLEVYLDDLTDEEVGLLHGLTAADGAKFRLSGSKGSVEREFTLEELQAFKDVFNVYIGLKQGLVSNK